MKSLATVPPGLRAIIETDDAVLPLASALEYMSCDQIRWRVSSGRWQRPGKGILVAQASPLTGSQKQRVAALWAGPHGALAGLTAARLAGLRGFDRDTNVVHILRPVGRRTRQDQPPGDVVVHYSRLLGTDDVHPVLTPRRTRVARSLIDAAEWMATDRGAQAILAAGVQQRLTVAGDLLREVERNGTHRRRGTLMRVTLRDIEGGSQALSELDFMRLVIRGFGLPVPDRQVARRDASGKRRWLDAFWERERVVVEIDGAGHLDVLQYWDDMDRDNQLKLDGYTVLRFPAFMVRHSPERVAEQIRDALLKAARPAGAGGEPPSGTRVLKR